MTLPRRELATEAELWEAYEPEWTRRDWTEDAEVDALLRELAGDHRAAVGRFPLLDETEL